MSEPADVGQAYGSPPQHYGSPPRAFERASKPITGPDVAAVALGFIAFVAAFFPYVGVSGKIGSFTFSVSINAWHSYAIVGLFLLVGAAVAVVVGMAAASANPPAEAVLDLVAACMAALGTMLIVVRALSYSGVSIRWGGWALIVAGAAETLCALASLLVLAARLRRDRAADGGTGSSAASYPAPS
jgi:hypothetical protein